jgi:hypothetical protein
MRCGPRLDDRTAGPPFAIERHGVDDGLAARCRRRDDGTPSGRGLPDGRELDRVAAGALERAADPGRHPQRQIAAFTIPSPSSSQISPFHSSICAKITLSAR